MNTLRHIVMTFLFVLLLAGCGNSQPAEEISVAERNTIEESHEENNAVVASDEAINQQDDAPEEKETDQGENEDSAEITPEATEEPTLETSDALDTFSLDGLAIGESTFTNYRESVTMIWNGKASDGSDVTMEMMFATHFQTEPNEANRTTTSTTVAGQPAFATDSALIDGQYYFYMEGQGCSIMVAQENQETLADSWDMEVALTGDGTLVEANVEVNGVTTNHYAIDINNIRESADDESIMDQITIDDGHVYVSVEDGQIIRLDVSGQDLTNGADFGFDLGQDVFYSLVVDYTPLGDEPVMPPTDCLDQENVADDYPLMEDAQNIATLPDSIFYESVSSFEDVINFYKTEMPLDNWILDSESVISSFGQLTFTRESETVNVKAIQNGEVVAITIEFAQ